MYPLRGNQDAAPRLHCCFLAAPPLSLHPLPSLINNCLKGFHAREPHRVLLSFGRCIVIRREGRDHGEGVLGMKVLDPEGLLEMVGAPEGAAWGNCLEGRGLVWLQGRG